ncbi:unnamed protein product [Nezara viridula]|uniref:Uncharacterized protein n=1 Tax=Nezara viridula TaxID=85310 RepID=A0A9P0MLR0_NEZVI|nr:unnamed protein product [Nezara viridula]
MLPETHKEISTQRIMAAALGGEIKQIWLKQILTKGNCFSPVGVEEKPLGRTRNSYSIPSLECRFPRSYLGHLERVPAHSWGMMMGTQVLVYLGLFFGLLGPIHYFLWSGVLISPLYQKLFVPFEWNNGKDIKHADIKSRMKT